MQALRALFFGRKDHGDALGASQDLDDFRVGGDHPSNGSEAARTGGTKDVAASTARRKAFMARRDGISLLLSELESDLLRMDPTYLYESSASRWSAKSAQQVAGVLEGHASGVTTLHDLRKLLSHWRHLLTDASEGRAGPLFHNDIDPPPAGAPAATEDPSPPSSPGKPAPAPTLPLIGFGDVFLKSHALEKLLEAMLRRPKLAELVCSPRVLQHATSDLITADLGEEELQLQLAYQSRRSVDGTGGAGGGGVVEWLDSVDATDDEAMKMDALMAGGDLLWVLEAVLIGRSKSARTFQSVLRELALHLDASRVPPPPAEPAAAPAAAGGQGPPPQPTRAATAASLASHESLELSRSAATKLAKGTVALLATALHGSKATALSAPAANTLASVESKLRAVQAEWPQSTFAAAPPGRAGGDAGASGGGGMMWSEEQRRLREERYEYELEACGVLLEVSELAIDRASKGVTIGHACGDRKRSMMGAARGELEALKKRVEEDHSKSRDAAKAAHASKKAERQAAAEMAAALENASEAASARRSELQDLRDQMQLEKEALEMRLQGLTDNLKIAGEEADRMASESQRCRGEVEVRGRECQGMAEEVAACDRRKAASQAALEQLDSLLASADEGQDEANGSLVTNSEGVTDSARGAHMLALRCRLALQRAELGVQTERLRFCKKEMGPEWGKWVELHQHGLSTTAGGDLMPDKPGVKAAYETAAGRVASIAEDVDALWGACVAYIQEAKDNAKAAREERARAAAASRLGTMDGEDDDSGGGGRAGAGGGGEAAGPFPLADRDPALALEEALYALMQALNETRSMLTVVGGDRPRWTRLSSSESDMTRRETKRVVEADVGESVSPEKKFHAQPAPGRGAGGEEEWTQRAEKEPVKRVVKPAGDATAAAKKD